MLAGKCEDVLFVNELTDLLSSGLAPAVLETAGLMDMLEMIQYIYSQVAQYRSPGSTASFASFDLMRKKYSPYLTYGRSGSHSHI